MSLLRLSIPKIVLEYRSASRRFLPFAWGKPNVAIRPHCRRLLVDSTAFGSKDHQMLGKRLIGLVFQLGSSLIRPLSC
jgi:hypothetical protein